MWIGGTLMTTTREAPSLHKGDPRLEWHQGLQPRVGGFQALQRRTQAPRCRGRVKKKQPLTIVKRGPLDGARGRQCGGKPSRQAPRDQ